MQLSPNSPFQPRSRATPQATNPVNAAKGQKALQPDSQATCLFDGDAFQPMRAYYAEPLTRQDKQEVLANVSGFFSVLREWRDKAINSVSKSESVNDEQ